MYSLNEMKQAVELGKNFIKSDLAMAAVCNKYGDKMQERKYFDSACKVNDNVISLGAQIRIIEFSIN